MKTKNEIHLEGIMMTLLISTLCLLPGSYLLYLTLKRIPNAHYLIRDAEAYTIIGMFFIVWTAVMFTIIHMWISNIREWHESAPKAEDYWDGDETDKIQY